MEEQAERLILESLNLLLQQQKTDESKELRMRIRLYLFPEK